MKDVILGRAQKQPKGYVCSACVQPFQFSAIAKPITPLAETRRRSVPHPALAVIVILLFMSGVGLLAFSYALSNYESGTYVMDLSDLSSSIVSPHHELIQRMANSEEQRKQAAATTDSLRSQFKLVADMAKMELRLSYWGTFKLDIGASRFKGRYHFEGESLFLDYGVGELKLRRTSNGFEMTGLKFIKQH